MPESGLKSKEFNRRARMAVLLLVLAFTTFIGYAHLHWRHAPPVGIDALCPFGAIESAYALVFTGTILKRLAASNFILIFAVLLVALVFRRSFCGMICPLGALQELFANLGRKIFGRQLAVPAPVDRPARLLKYPVLALVVVFTAATGELVIRPYDPWVAYHHITSADLFTEFTAGFIVLILTLAGSFLFNRVFCKYLCPMGAFLAPFNKFGWYGISRSEKSCLRCKSCNAACPVQIDVAGSSRINDPECISCNECVNVCPSGDALIVAGPAASSGLRNRVVLGAVVAAFILVIGSTTITGNFQWKLPSLEKTVEAAGQLDPGLIRGRMTLMEVADVYGITPQAFIDRFGVEKADLGVPMKEIAKKYGFKEPDDIRAFVGEYRTARQ